jgi:hypothetical protein
MAPNLRDHLEILKHTSMKLGASIAPTIDPASVEIAREGLAEAIVAHANTLGTDDLAALKAAALASFRKQLTSSHPQRVAPRLHRQIC